MSNEWVELQRLVKQIPGDQRKAAWDLMKTDGFAAAISYVERILAAENERLGADKLRDERLPFRVWGREGIDDAAMQQMTAAMYLPITTAGALMPDAHVGYGLPIGGVLATQGAVIPYAVGVDIACRMRLSVFNIPADYIDREHGALVDIVQSVTQFGAGAYGIHDGVYDHAVLDDAKWQGTSLLRSLRNTAVRQVGTSGGGNHFADICAIEAHDVDQNEVTPGAGKWLALMTHSGSRGVGAKIADYYSRLAASLHPNLDASVARLAWLDMNDAGAEYWAAMELAGEFAAANHEIIHRHFTQALGIEPFKVVENHHNFAWREVITVDGTQTEAIVHRKGATPAGQGVWGVIPGSMATPGYVVTGRGDSSSLNSASHGSGRLMSRTKAKQNIDPLEVKRQLKAAGVTLLGGGLDEAPDAYKDGSVVIAAQSDLVRIEAVLRPRIVIMADDSKPLRGVPAGIEDAGID